MRRHSCPVKDWKKEAKKLEGPRLLNAPSTPSQLDHPGRREALIRAGQKPTRTSPVDQQQRLNPTHTLQQAGQHRNSIALLSTLLKC
tara:strand:+ start:1018 stop:1278 length:261 start_codon:yes stop_codon:yes gene_type:complete